MTERARVPDLIATMQPQAVSQREHRNVRDVARDMVETVSQRRR